jgi:hypothetical protein
VAALPEGHSLEFTEVPVLALELHLFVVDAVTAGAKLAGLVFLFTLQNGFRISKLPAFKSHWHLAHGWLLKLPFQEGYGLLSKTPAQQARKPHARLPAPAQ